MPGSFIGELILGPIFEFVFGVVCYYIGHVVVVLVSLGRLQCDRIATDTSRCKLEWGGLFYRRGKQIYLTEATTSLVGLLFVILIVVGVFLFYYLKE
jgi:hypothetical protein